MEEDRPEEGGAFTPEGLANAPLGGAEPGSPSYCRYRDPTIVRRNLVNTLDPGSPTGERVEP